MVSSIDGNSRSVVKRTSSGIESGNGSTSLYYGSSDNNSVDTSNSLTGTSQHERQEKRNRRRVQKRQERNQRKQRAAKELGSSSSQTFSLLWTVLAVGVVLSFVDVIYIMKHIDSDPSSPATIHQQQQQLKQQQSLASFVENQKAQHEGLDKSNSNSNNKKNEKNPYLDLKARLAAKGPIIDLITEAGISFDPVEDADLLDELPDWDDVVQMYGAKPIIHGINEGNCQRFQQHSDAGEHLVGTAGTFNSGTNLMAELLIHNCMMPERMKKYGSKNRGIRWQVSRSFLQMRLLLYPSS